MLVYDLLVNNGSSLTIDSVSGHFVVYEDETKAVLLESHVGLDDRLSNISLNGLAPASSLTAKDLSTYGRALKDVPNPYLELVFDNFTSNEISYVSAKSRSQYNDINSLRDILEARKSELADYKAALELE